MSKGQGHTPSPPPSLTHNYYSDTLYPPLNINIPPTPSMPTLNAVRKHTASIASVIAYHATHQSFIINEIIFIITIIVDNTQAYG